MKRKKFSAGEFMLTAIPIFIIVFWILVVFSIGYLVFHPEMIGEYIGKIMNGFR
ncbi:hypothetical protein [Enterococcus avium]|uniref:hypothetical protein n=1 Tax=Enterococcus avium TaxID=33945 RepID=UPI00187CDCB7|nr:hypothetical protein [Enterococcus avium]